MNFPLAPSSLLEVGALKPDNYASCQTWIDVTPIDLHAQHPDIREQDFLLMHPEEHRERWDVISLSLVLNFPPDPKDRGKCIAELGREGWLCRWTPGSGLRVTV